MKPRNRYRVLLKTQAIWRRLEIMGRSQNWLAHQAGISPGYLSALVNEGRAPSGCIRRRIQRALNAPDFDELFELERHDDNP